MTRPPGCPWAFPQMIPQKYLLPCQGRHQGAARTKPSGPPAGHTLPPSQAGRRHGHSVRHPLPRPAQWCRCQKGRPLTAAWAGRPQRPATREACCSCLPAPHPPLQSDKLSRKQTGRTPKVYDKKNCFLTAMENTKHIKEGTKGRARGGGACVTKMKKK